LTHRNRRNGKNRLVTLPDYSATTATWAANVRSELPGSQQLHILSGRLVQNDGSAAIVWGRSARSTASTRGASRFALLLVFTSAPQAPRNGFLDAQRNSILAVNLKQPNLQPLAGQWLRAT
jgi:hypothetical protein